MEELEKNPTLISGLYGQSCFCYDHPEIYGEVVEKEFEDYALKGMVYHLRWEI